MLVSPNDQIECFTTRVFGLSGRHRCREFGIGGRGIVRRRRGRRRAARLRVGGLPSDMIPLRTVWLNRSIHTSLVIDRGDADVLWYQALVDF